MQDLKFISLFLDPLEEKNFSYLVFGSVASILYGEPRTTTDIDLGIYLDSTQLKSLKTLYPDTDYYLPPDDVLVIENQRSSRGHFNVIHHNTGYKADFYPSRNHPYLKWALENRRETEILGSMIKLAPPEYVILGKLEFYQEGKSTKHLSDIAGILKVQKEALDYNFLERATTVLGIKPEWELVKSL